MRWLALALLVFAACHAKPDASSAPAGSAGSGATAAGSAAAPPSGGSADKPPAVSQPKRSPEDTARVAAADQAVAAAITKAKAANTAKDACAALPELSSKLDELQKVTPPAGLEQEFSEKRNGLVMKIDALQHQTCSDPQATPDMVADDLESLRDRLVKLEGIGAKP